MTLKEAKEQLKIKDEKLRDINRVLDAYLYRHAEPIETIRRLIDINNKGGK